MAEQQGEKLRGVDWGEVFPWLILGRTFRIAVQLRHLALSAAGFVLMLSGWALFDRAFIDSEAIRKTESSMAREAPGVDSAWVAAGRLVPDSPAWLGQPAVRWEAVMDHPRVPPEAMPGQSELGPAAPSGWRRALWDPFWGTWEQLSRPFSSIFATGMTVTGTVLLLLRGLWAVAVWAFFGAAVARASAYELATCERPGLGALLKYARSAWRMYFGSIGIPLLGILPVGMLVLLPGLLLLSQYTVWLAGLVFWPLALVGGSILAVLTLGLLFGWPIMWGSLAADKPDSFDAIGRGYQFTFQRPLHYFFYAVVAAALGALGWFVVSNFAATIVAMTWWAVSWIGTAARVQEIATAPGNGWLAVGATLVRFWIGCLKMLAVGFLFSYFWASSAAIYLLLRRDVDGKEMDEVYIDEEPSEPLPPIRADAEGAPVMAASGPSQGSDE